MDVSQRNLGGMVDELQRRVARGADDVRAYMASPEGQQLRRRVAQVMIVAAPLLFRFGRFKTSRLGHLFGVLGGAAVMVKLAEALRDWDPLQDVREAPADHA